MVQGSRLVLLNPPLVLEGVEVLGCEVLGQLKPPVWVQIRNHRNMTKEIVPYGRGKERGPIVSSRHPNFFLPQGTIDICEMNVNDINRLSRPLKVQSKCDIILSLEVEKKNDLSQGKIHTWCNTKRQVDNSL